MPSVMTLGIIRYTIGDYSCKLVCVRNRLGGDSLEYRSSPLDKYSPSDRSYFVISEAKDFDRHCRRS